MVEQPSKPVTIAGEAIVRKWHRDRARAGWRLLIYCLAFTICWAARADRQGTPFVITPTVVTRGAQTTVRLQFTVPAEHILYADRLRFLNEDGDMFTALGLPEPIIAKDKSDGHEKRMFTNGFSAVLNFSALPTNLIVKFQGCSNSACYFPQKKAFRVTAAVVTPIGEDEPSGSDETPAGSWVVEAAQFKTVGRTTGYMGAEKFIAFLDKALTGEIESDGGLAKYKKAGVLLTMLLIVVGGLGLNLTPCVLPLIPINLAIIHAGRAAHSRRGGFLHGAAYGAGMSIVYGMLGLIVVLTGSKFGALNSSVWFNTIIAVIFVILSLAMFDIFHIDFTRFDRRVGRSEARAAQGKKSQWLVAFTLGCIAALLAGACVAPVVISVLLLATDMYGKGAVIGLALPFLLGLGMALPWPFMGASLSFLPKPGKWMVRVKQSFGVIILLFALYYGHTAYGIFKASGAVTTLAGAAGTSAQATSTDPSQTLASAFQRARVERKPVFIDFAASWCKNCVAMDETVFNREEVKRRLQSFIVVRYDAEKPNELPAKAVLDHFQVIGLPTFIVLQPPTQGARTGLSQSAAPESSRSSL